MTLQKTQAKSVEERRKEIVSAVDEYTRIERYFAYETLPEVAPYDHRPENIRFFSDGLEFLVSVKDSTDMLVKL